jgi:hypothetical protein
LIRGTFLFFDIVVLNFYRIVHQAVGLRVESAAAIAGEANVWWKVKQLQFGANTMPEHQQTASIARKKRGPRQH